MIRQRKPRKDLTDFENDHCVALRSERPCYWVVKCKYCNEEHEQSSREIQNNAKSRQCETFKPSNYKGYDAKDSYYIRTYGITHQDYQDMLEAQDGVCAICGQEEQVKERGLSVDHCHTTGKVRGLLCSY